MKPQLNECSNFRDKLKETVEARRPMTRNRLESMIISVQEKLDDSIKRKSFTEAAPLQDELEALILKRGEIPTIDELKEAVKNAESAVAAAAQRRDFAAAASLQSEIESAKQRLD